MTVGFLRMINDMQFVDDIQEAVSMFQFLVNTSWNSVTSMCDHKGNEEQREEKLHDWPTAGPIGLFRAVSHVRLDHGNQSWRKELTHVYSRYFVQIHGVRHVRWRSRRVLSEHDYEIEHENNYTVHIQTKKNSRQLMTAVDSTEFFSHFTDFFVEMGCTNEGDCSKLTGICTPILKNNTKS